ncbi:DUF4238 domain-containing protein [Taibaiella soli]|uniref:DUF4238 domain-containing protein n=1 Tax=Taibaiella soli TaxID=1649169 RepID=A0A2W2AMI2_9BACT|nr:DUF4238 domain-containing protein [Taibaiella soli]PZF74742.1 hypothetical protein DN068_00660 [Taibaiella soli]
MNIEDTEFGKYLNKKSSRHHYIPQFLINGFKNENGLLYIFDKNKDEILSKPRPPKSIFFENDRNTLQIDEKNTSSILEDSLYSTIDNQISKIIYELQSAPLQKIDLTDEKVSKMIFFLITLFWRIPATDFAADNIFANSKILVDGIELNHMHSDAAMNKINRAGLFKHHIDQMILNGIKGQRVYNIHEVAEDVCVIGDNPILFKNFSNKFSEFNDTDILMAVSSNRIFSSTFKPLKKFSAANLRMFNIQIIEQSSKYIACGNLEVLKNAVELYRTVVKKGAIHTLNNWAFEEIT